MCYPTPHCTSSLVSFERLYISKPADAQQNCTPVVIVCVTFLPFEIKYVSIKLIINHAQTACVQSLFLSPTENMSVKTETGLYSTKLAGCFIYLFIYF